MSRLSVESIWFPDTGKAATVFLVAGGHPGIGERDDAYLSQILALTFGHALLLKLESWSRNDFSNF
jgi:hypothetical protein